MSSRRRTTALREPGSDLTINGVHLNEEGDALFSRALFAAVVRRRRRRRSNEALRAGGRGQEPAVFPPLPAAQHLLLHRRAQQGLRLSRLPAGDAELRPDGRQSRPAHLGHRAGQGRRRQGRRLERPAAAARSIETPRRERMAVGRRRAEGVPGRSAVRGESVRRRGAVPRDRQPDPDALGRARPAVGELLDDLSARLSRATSRATSS